MKFKSLATVVSVLALGAVVLAKRKVPSQALSPMTDLTNRLLLCWRFFRATEVDGPIQEVEFDFVYLDGERSPHTKRIYGRWGIVDEQPDRLVRQPVWLSENGCDGFEPFRPEERLAMTLARTDRERGIVSRSRGVVIEHVMRWRNRSVMWAGSPPCLTDVEQERAMRAYTTCFASYPRWPVPPARVMHPSKADGPLSS